MQEMKQIRVIDKCLIKVIVSLHLAFAYSLTKGTSTIHTHYDMSHKEDEVVPLLQLELEELEKEIEEIEAEVEDDRVREVPEDIQHQLEAEAFGDYLIIINDYKEADFELFTGSKQELNEHLKALNLHNAPKVYALKQIPVHTTYSV